MATVELSQAGDSSILIIYKAGNSGNIRNEQKAIHFASAARPSLKVKLDTKTRETVDGYTPSWMWNLKMMCS